jgi:sterol desaturase/sphingolipid hydroxylase (fatty acid hydroxylase superfamily)
MLDVTALFETPVQWSKVLTGELAAFVLLASFALLSSLEFIFPRDLWSKTNLRQSYKANISLFCFNSTTMSLLSVSSLFILAGHYSQHGLLRYLDNPVWQGILAFILLDLLLYLWHRVCHHFDCLWIFHRVHHNDPYLNVSTAFRVHVVELLLTNVLKALYIVLMGVDQVMVLVNEVLTTLFVMFHHSNITFKAEKKLGQFIIVPSQHRIHHSVARHEHDSNYGAILTLWDRLLASMTDTQPAAIGIDGPSPQGAFGLVKFGFARARTQPKRAALEVSLDAMIAEAAYYKAEKRGFNPGYEVLDWLEAKREVIKQMSSGDNHKPEAKKRSRLMVLN